MAITNAGGIGGFFGSGTIANVNFLTNIYLTTKIFMLRGMLLEFRFTSSRIVI